MAGRTPKPALGASRAPPGRAPTQMDLDHAFKRRDWNPAWVAKVQELCLAYPEAIEAEQFGGPWWKAGQKPFCFYGASSEKRADGYHGVDGIGVKLPLLEQEAVLRDPRFERERYIGRHGWTLMRFEGRIAWDEVAELVDEAYRGVANRRMLAKLDAGNG
jgi:hypothetical protein